MKITSLKNNNPSVWFDFKKFEDTKGVFGVRKSKKDRQHNGQKKKDKRTNNDLQNMSHKT